jgi:formylmethanofuran dehydrogenase subunit E
MSEDESAEPDAFVNEWYETIITELHKRNNELQQSNKLLEEKYNSLLKMANDQLMKIQSLEATLNIFNSTEDGIALRCRICFERPITQVPVPCGHAIACAGCLETSPTQCCLCRRPIDKIIKLYLG